MLNEYIKQIKDYCINNSNELYRQPDGILKYPFLVPGANYGRELWDWDSWLTDVALRQIYLDSGKDLNELYKYEKGSILNFLINTDDDGKMPIQIMSDKVNLEINTDRETNMHKPCIAQHIAFILTVAKDNTTWIKDSYPVLEKFLARYKAKNLHKCGIYFLTDDFMQGVDNDPSSYFRPKNSSGTTFFNFMMYKELCAMAFISNALGYSDKEQYYNTEAENLKNAIRDCCWDERMGYYYGVDFNLLPIDPNQWLHSGAPRHWDYLIQRLEVWSGFLALWSGVATKEQAERIVEEHFKNEKTFSSPYGVRSLSKMEKMYSVVRSGNPSCWLGPIWGVVNYLIFKGLLKYGYTAEAKDLCEKTIKLFGSDIASCGKMHEYYSPEDGTPVHNIGFQSWNLLVMNMIAWYEGRTTISEF